jgi:thiol-disulfide isomerase/thioredoxin
VGVFRDSGFAFKGRFAILFLLLAAGPGLHAAGAPKNDPPKSDAPKPGEPTDPKARKTFASAQEWENHHNYEAAMDDYRKANKQDGGHCPACLGHAYLIARQIGSFKDEEEIAREMLTQAGTEAEKASVHYLLALALQDEGISNKKEKCFSDSCDEFKTALELEPRLALAHYGYGVSLAHLHQDDAAREEFAAFLAQDKKSSDLHDRAQRYMQRIELARAKMAPPFSLITLDGRHISLDGLAGKVVLIDFWATWCGPCREALPHIRQIAKKFDGQPLVVLSISLDSDEAKWKDFVGKNGMTWMQYREGGFEGSISKQFNVTAIPATFTIDADGVLEDQHVGDADIEGKLKKLIAGATEAANRKATAEGLHSEKAASSSE